MIIHDDLGTNVSYTWPLVIEENEGDCQKAMDTSAHVVKERYVQQRLIPMAMEPRAVVAIPQPFGGDMTLYSSTQVPHILKVMTALTLGIPEQQMRVVCPSVGGGFGSKLNVYAEELLCVQLARTLGTPVRWNEERSENAQATCHGRGQIQDIELAADADGKITGLRVRLIADMGAYLQLVTPGVPLLGAFLYGGVYEIPKAFDFSCTSVFTTMTPTDAYRGAGRPEATYAIEHAMDALARKVGIDPLELRRRNFIKKESFPYEAYTGLVYDSGDHDKAATIAEDLIDYSGAASTTGGAERARLAEAAGHRSVDLLRDVWPRPVTRARLAELLGRRLGVRNGSGVADLEDPGGHRNGATRAGPRDGVVDDRRRQVRRRSGRRRRAALRHRDRPPRPRHLRIALAAGGRCGDRYGL